MLQHCKVQTNLVGETVERDVKDGAPKGGYCLQSPVLMKDLKLKLTSSAIAAASNLNF